MKDSDIGAQWSNPDSTPYMIRELIIKLVEERAWLLYWRDNDSPEEKPDIEGALRKFGISPTDYAEYLKARKETEGQP